MEDNGQVLLSIKGILMSNNNSSNEDEFELRRGPWSLEEDNLLIHYISTHGGGRWNDLAKCAEHPCHVILYHENLFRIFFCICTLIFEVVVQQLHFNSLVMTFAIVGVDKSHPATHINRQTNDKNQMQKGKNIVVQNINMSNQQKDHNIQDDDGELNQMLWRDTYIMSHAVTEANHETQVVTEANHETQPVNHEDSDTSGGEQTMISENIGTPIEAPKIISYIIRRMANNQQ
ncbi:hypothetical protein RND71_032205 [Anisodus tanguticus]|uniref:Uncharacterized protein n=1 Tax=Anisodus tanguticus TaxID=243964 RepID=A0AAE1V6I7_9SOLA|nr:hypothetical protein RND71_032205 [Anisodus tanguticus]